MPSDFEDEEIDEELAFTAEDKARFGGWFDEDGGLGIGGGGGSESDEGELFGDEGEDPLAEEGEEKKDALDERRDLDILYSSEDEGAPPRRKVSHQASLRLG